MSQLAASMPGSSDDSSTDEVYSSDDDADHNAYLPGYSIENVEAATSDDESDNDAA